MSPLQERILVTFCCLVWILNNVYCGSSILVEVGLKLHARNNSLWDSDVRSLLPLQNFTVRVCIFVYLYIKVSTNVHSETTLNKGNTLFLFVSILPYQSSSILSVFHTHFQDFHFAVIFLHYLILFCTVCFSCWRLKQFIHT